MKFCVSRKYQQKTNEYEQMLRHAMVVFVAYAHTLCKVRSYFGTSADAQDSSTGYFVPLQAKVEMTRKGEYLKRWTGLISQILRCTQNDNILLLLRAPRLVGMK
jgi:hypothetical protein